MQEAARYIQRITRTQYGIHHRCSVTGGRGNGRRVVGPRLAAQWVDMDRFMHSPVLLACYLQDEDVVYVVVRGETL